MKIAVPVHDETLKVFRNAGHTPYFAIFTVVGSGPFRSTQFLQLRENPRVNLDAEAGCQHEHSGEECDEEKRAHKEEHRVMAEILHDCDHLVVSKACKNTKQVLEEANISVTAIQNQQEAKALIAEFLKKR
jgi:predicted Fe-Mo cluster-binding NifX family protein